MKYLKKLKFKLYICKLYKKEKKLNLIDQNIIKKYQITDINIKLNKLINILKYQIIYNKVLDIFFLIFNKN